MTTLITPAEREQIARRLADLELVHGVGDLDEHRACTIAAIQLALTGELTDADQAGCISPVSRSWVIRTQDAMPVDMINTIQWRELIPWIAGTRTDDLDIEARRLNLIFGWMLDRLAQIRPLVAELDNVADEWDTMITAGRTYLEAAEAAWAAEVAEVAEVAEAARAAWAAEAARAAGAAGAAEAAEAARAARAAEAAALVEYWTTADPVKLLRQLIDAGVPATAS